MDAKGDLWVSDINRVLEYKPPFTSGMAASLVLGQPDLKTLRGGCGSDLRSMCFPTGLAFDQAGDLWVADSNNSRVLEFRQPFSSGMAATLVLGNVANAGSEQYCLDPASAGSMCWPNVLAFDSHGNLWVSDGAFDRVLQFSSPFSTGMAASLVLGQPDMTHSGEPATATLTVMNPYGLAFDSAGNLLVSDDEFQRVLIFAPPFQSGMSARTVIGQPSVNSYTPVGTCNAPAANTVCGPGGLLMY